MKQDVAPHPLAIGFFRAWSLVFSTHRIAHLIQQLRRSFGTISLSWCFPTVCHTPSHINRWKNNATDWLDADVVALDIDSDIPFMFSPLKINVSVVTSTVDRCQ